MEFTKKPATVQSEKKVFMKNGKDSDIDGLKVGAICRISNHDFQMFRKV